MGSGLRMGRCARRRPDLFFAVLAAVLPLCCRGAPPQPVGSFDVHGFAADQMTASWTAYSGAQLLDLRWWEAGEGPWASGIELLDAVTSHTATGLSAGVKYEFSIRALGIAGEYSAASTASGETLSETRATNVRSVEVLDRSVKLGWKTATSADAVSQKVYISWDGGSTWRYNAASDEGPLLAGTDAELVVPSLVPATPYLFRVDTLFLGAEGAMESLPSSIVTTVPAMPRKVVGLAVSAVTSTSLTLSWTALSGRDSIGSVSVLYRVEVLEDGAGFPDPSPFNVAHGTTLNVTGLLRNAQHRVRVTAVNDRGLAGPPSDVVTGSTSGSVPHAPEAPSVLLEDGGILVSWAALQTNEATGGFGILRYLLHRRREDEIIFDAGQDVGLTTTYLVSSGLTSNYKYRFTVSAVNSLGASVQSASSSEILPPVGPMLSAPTAAISQDGQGSLITLSWPPPALATNVLAYRSYMRQVAPSSAFDAGYMVSAPTVSYPFLPDYIQFEFKIEALTAAGWTNSSAITTAETLSDDTPTSARASLVASTCSLNVTWTPPRRTPLQYRVFSVNMALSGGTTVLIAGSQRSYLTPGCDRGTTFTFSVQALYANSTASVISRRSAPVTVPPSIPAQMDAPTLVLSTLDPSTRIVISWPPLSTGTQTGGSPILSFTVFVQKTLLGTSFTLELPGSTVSYEITDLQQDVQYRFRVQARNALGLSPESNAAVLKTSSTSPAQIVNFTVAPGSEKLSAGQVPTVSLTLSWAVPLSGDSNPVTAYKIFQYRVGDDYNPGQDISATTGLYVLSGLPGGVDFTFFIQAKNSQALFGPLSKALEYRTVSVAPRQITSLKVVPASSPDTISGYKIGLQWSIPIDAETTGGSALRNFILRYANLSSCLSGCTDVSAACVAQRSSITWTSAGIASGTGSVGAVSSYTLVGSKGLTYVFSIAAQNVIGQGPFWPTCDVQDTACRGQGSPACFDPVITKPAKIQNFGVLGPGYPGVTPRGPGSARISWGVVGVSPDPYYEYTDRAVNGGRTVLKIEVQRAELGTLQWPLDFYCPNTLSTGVCEYQTGCTPNLCEAKCPTCVSDRVSSESYNLKYIDDFANLDTEKIYAYRIRFSNVDTCTGGLIPVGTTSSSCYTWSDWSDYSYMQVQQVNTYSNILTQVTSPTTIRVGWIVPNTLAPAAAGDQVVIYYGATAASVLTFPFTGSIKVNGGLPSDSGPISSTFAVSGLQPAKTYYFAVVGYYTSDGQELESTRSQASFATTTQIGRPQQVKNVTITVPPAFSDQLLGSIVVAWIPLGTSCLPSDGVFLADESVRTCPKGEDLPLKNYRIYYQLSSDSSSWTTIDVGGEVTTHKISGLEKGQDYNFQVTAVNSAKESMLSTTVTNKTLVTVPGPPAAPRMNGASPRSIRISWSEPEDTGASPRLQLPMSAFQVVMEPRRDLKPGNETTLFTTAKETVLTGLQPNTQYRIFVQARNNFYPLFGVASESLYAASTPAAPVNIRLAASPTNDTFNVLTVQWDWVGVIQGPLTIVGYRISSRREGHDQVTETLCSGGPLLQCRLEGFARGVTYVLTIAASNDPRLETSFGPESEPLILTTPASLPTVTILPFTNTTAQSTTINWNIETGGLQVLGYRLRVQREAEGFDNGTAITGSSSFSVFGLGPNLVYTFIVVAQNSAGYRESSPSEGVLTLPAPPSMPEIQVISSSFISLAWSRWYGKNPVLEHVLQARYNGGPGQIGAWFGAGDSQGGDVSATIHNLFPNSGVDVRVASVNAAGVGAYSEYSHAITLPRAPSLVYVSTITSDSVIVHWVPSEGADGRYHYVVYPFYRDGGQAFASDPVITAEGPLTQWALSGLARGTAYFFKVASAGVLGEGEMSAASHDITTLLSVPQPGNKPAASEAAPFSMRVTWTKTAAIQTGGSPILRYRIYVRSERGGVYSEYALNQEVSAVNSTFVATNLISNAAYQFRIAAVNAIGEGPMGSPSDPFSTLPGPMPAPVQQAFLSTIILTWTAPVNATTTGFRVYFQEFNSATSEWLPYTMQVVAATTLTVKFDSLKSDNRYRFWLAARNPSGWGADGNKVESRTTIRPDPWTLNAAGEVQLAIPDQQITPTSAALIWFGPATDPVNGPALRGSAVGYQVIACRVQNQLCDPGTEYLVLCVDSLPYSLAHCCQASCKEYTRQGLLKNTEYYFQLAVVNPGGPGPYSRPSPTFRTQSDFPIQMDAPRVVTLSSTTSFRVLWDPIVDFNDRGGLDITAYYLYRREEGGSYGEPEIIYDGSEFTYTGLPSNTRYYFAVLAENTWCTTCPDTRSCVFPLCCDDHTCTPKSIESEPLSTLPQKMSTPFIVSANTFSILVGWEPVSGTANNILRYELEYRDIDRGSQAETGAWITRIFPGTGATSFQLLNLNPNNRYEVLLRADNGIGYGEQSDSGILVTKAERVVPAPEAAEIRATVVTLDWEAPRGRQKNIYGYNISYRVAAQQEKLVGAPLEQLPLISIFAPGKTPRANAVNLMPNTTYVFTVAAVNGGGTADFSRLSLPYTTMAQDRLAACVFYAVGASEVGGSLLLQESAIGDPPSTLTGALTGLPQMGVRLVLREYGQSSGGFGYERNVLFINQTRDDGMAEINANVLLPLQGEASVLGSSLLIQELSGEAVYAQCELGMAAPRGGAFLNAARPRHHSRAFCSMLTLEQGLRLRGGFIASPTDRGLRIRGRVCGLPLSLPNLPAALHEYGDVGTGIANVGASIFPLGDMVIDNLGSGNYDLLDATSISFSADSKAGIIGRSIVIYNPTGSPLGACVFGAYEPSIEATIFADSALPAVCVPCTWLLGLQESLYSVAERFGNDWISVWSLNTGNPDLDQSGNSIFYAHPYQIAQGESVTSVMVRFGLTVLEISKLNPGRSTFSEGDVVCVAPRWDIAVDRTAKPVCRGNKDRVV